MNGEIPENAHINGSENTTRKNDIVPLWSLFRYATCLDILILILGSLMAMIAGLCLPFVVIILGHVIAEFSDFTIANRFNSTDEFYCMNETQKFDVFDYKNAENPGNMLCNKISVFSFANLVVGIAFFLSSFLSNVLWTLSASHQKQRIRKEFLQAILKQDVGYYDLNPPTELPAHFSDDIQKIEEGIGRNFGNFIQELFSLLASFMIALSYNWKLTLVTSVFLPVLLIVLGIVGKVTASATIQELNLLAKAGSVAEEVLSSIKTVMAFGGQTKEIQRYNSFLNQANQQTYKKHFTTSFIYGFYTTVVFSYYALGLWYGAQLLVDCKDISLGDILIVILEIGGGSVALGNGIPLIASIATAMGSASIVFGVIDQEPEADSNSTGGTTPDSCEGSIQFSDVTFSYPSRPDVQILHGLDLSIKPGQTVALVGPSGCGKSTIMQLILRMYKYNTGKISLDGTDIKDLNVSWLRNQIGIVSQEPVLFNVSIAKNISYGKDGATEKEIKTAAMSANAHNFISELPDRYKTMVGEGGAQLSGGQKQRMAIARALVRDPKILLLDEATSALDTESEKVVQDALDKARKGRTTIIIAHRLSTIQTADVIVGIDNGHVVEMGSHRELMKKEGLYYQLVLSQTIKEKDEDHSDEFKESVITSAQQRRNAFRRNNSHISESIESQPILQHSQSRRNFNLPNERQLLKRKSSIQMLSRQISRDVLPLTSVGRMLSLTRMPSYRNRRRSSSGILNTPIEEDLSFDVDSVFGDEIQSDNLKKHSSMKNLMKFHKPPSFNSVIQPQQSSLKDLLKFSKPEWWLLVPGITSYIMIGILLSAVYVLMSKALEPFSETDADDVVDGVTVYSIWYAVLGFVGFLLHFVGTFCLSVAADRLTKRIRHESFQAILKQDMTFFDRPENSVSALVTELVVDAYDINQVVGLRLGLVLRASFNAIASAIFALQASWVLALVTLPCYPILLLGGYLQIRLTKRYIEKSKMALDISSVVATEAIDNVYTITSLGIRERIVSHYDQFLQRSSRYITWSAIIHGLLYGFSQSFVIMVTSGAYSLGAVIYLLDESEPYYADFSDIFQAITAVLFTSILFKELFDVLPDSQKAQISAASISRLLNETPTIDSFNEKGASPDMTLGALDIQSAKFTYPSRPGVSILNSLTVNIKPGQTLALVGPSGSGKSTVISLAERFYDPNSGCIKLDGVDLRDLNISWLRRQISLVSQEPVLFDMSIEDNIRYGALFREVSDEEVIEAAKSANIHDFIQTLPQGYSTNVGLKGTQLSGGQKQRVAIARALVRDPKILLLDEATSALDTESERIVQDALDKARKGRTTIIIAHRLSTIYNSDRIAVLYKGSVAEQGTHSELMNKKEAYYFMNNVQKLESV